jgi:hypothetical protein
MTIQTISDLPTLVAQTTPISTAVKNYYANNVAFGSGQPCNTFLTSDFFGSAAGVPGTTVVNETIQILQRRINDGTLTNLADIYAVMKAVVSGDYGNPVTGPVTIPGGEPGAGSYTDAEDAFQILVPLAESAISTAATAMGADTTTMNSGFEAIARGVTNEAANLARAGVDFATLPAVSQTSVLAFVTALSGYGQNTAPGQSAEVLAALADQTNATGQAIVGALREGSNNQQLDAVGINRYNTIPTPD